MKRVDFKKHSSVFYIGKGLIIASIVVTASLGFLLGFFVGKQAQPLPETQSGNIVPLKESEQPPLETREKEVSHQSDTVQLPAPVKNEKPVQEQQPDIQQVTPRDSGITSAEKRHAQPDSPSPPKKKQAEEIRPKQETPEQKNSKSSQDALKPRKTPLTRKYTVQVGAFKNPEEADILKTKMSKKGYNAFVTESKTKKQEILHKVMVGAYKTRKEAEILSIKLKNSEGLRTFVTFVMQEGATRHQ
jgi:cell division septation protein DedD